MRKITPKKSSVGTQKTIHGFSVINPKNFSALIKKSGVGNFQKLSPPLPIETYLKKKLTPHERRELLFAPRVEAIPFKNPRGGRFTGFRCRYKNGVLIFALLPGNMLPVCAEFRHGCERVMLNLPAGLIEPNDKSPKIRAGKEFEEEIGISLKKLIPLNSGGVPMDARVLTRKNFFFLGIPKKPLVVQKQKTHAGEFVARFLIRLEDWLEFMKLGMVDDCSITGTLFALEKLNQLHKPK